MATPRCRVTYMSRALAQRPSRVEKRSSDKSPGAQGILTSSAKCKSVRKPHANLPDTPVALTSASKYFQILSGPPGALQSALRLCKSVLRCS